MARTRSAGGIWLADQAAAARSGTRLAVALALAGTACGIGQALLVGAMLSRGTVPGAWPLIGFVALALARAGWATATDLAANSAGARARRRLRTAVLGNLLRVGPALLRTGHSAGFAGVAVDRVESLDGYFARYLPAVRLAVAGPALVLLATVFVDPWAALILAVCGALVPFAMALAGIGAAQAARRQLQALDRLQVRFVDRVRGIATLVTLGRGADETAALRRSADELRVRTMRILRVAFLSSAALDLALAAAIVVNVLRLTGDTGRAVTVVLLTLEFFAPLRNFALAYQDRSQAAAAADAIAALPDAPAPVAVHAEPRTIQAHGVAVAFEHVSVRWDPSRAPALDDLSFRVPAGETLVLAGPSGSGKSTVLEVLLGFIHPDGGRATLNGISVSDLAPEALARLIGWVGQRPTLLAASLAENIRFARPDASDAEVADAARSARLGDLIAELPDGSQTQIGEGGHGISGGQAQRLAIARAYLRNAPLLLLDEPTSQLDPATEREVLDSLRRLLVGRTAIIASHSSAVHAFSGRRLDLSDGRTSVLPERAA